MAEKVFKATLGVFQLELSGEGAMTKQAALKEAQNLYEDGKYDLFVCDSNDECVHLQHPYPNAILPKLYEIFSDKKRRESIIFKDEDGKEYRLTTMDNAGKIGSNPDGLEDIIGNGKAKVREKADADKRRR
ncbi:MAG: hypothetical protein HY540_03385 [Deltaproteobacteria bacterium]|nr:hypothetical protein [Deltaproteobacteria bacterium]